MLHARERSSVQLSRGCYQRGHSKMKLLADPGKQVLNAENVPWSVRSQQFQTLRTLLFASKSRMAQGVNKLLDVGSLFRRFLLFASVQTLELGKFLPCTLGGTRADERLSKPVVDDRGVTVNLKGLFILGDGVVVLVLVRIKDAELEIRIGVARIERDRGLE